MTAKNSLLKKYTASVKIPPFGSLFWEVNITKKKKKLPQIFHNLICFNNSSTEIAYVNRFQRANVPYFKVKSIEVVVSN